MDKLQAWQYPHGSLWKPYKLAPFQFHHPLPWQLWFMIEMVNEKLRCKCERTGIFLLTYITFPATSPSVILGFTSHLWLSSKFWQDPYGIFFCCLTEMMFLLSMHSLTDPILVHRLYAFSFPSGYLIISKQIYAFEVAHDKLDCISFHLLRCS